MEDKSEALSNRIAEIKLRRIQEFNSRLKEALLRDRIPASNASLLITNYVQDTPDYIIPSLWKLQPEQNKFKQYERFRKLRQANSDSSNCCTIV